MITCQLLNEKVLLLFGFFPVLASWMSNFAQENSIFNKYFVFLLFLDFFLSFLFI
jgi:hypothetical protein